MKYKHFIGSIIIMVLLAGCDNGPIPSSHKLVLPVLPGDWVEILGEPHWRLQWIDEAGSWQNWDLAPGTETPGLSLLSEWTSPVLAWPFWPSWALYPGMMRPAGALFPWDVDGFKLKFSWRGGVEAIFWKELAEAERLTGAAEGRFPWLFDWPRFRELLESDDVPDSVRQDPWLVDWKELGGKTIQSGFDRRRIKVMKLTEMEIPELEGRWICSSPFAIPLLAPPGGPLNLEVTDAVGTWVSEMGVLKCSSLGFVFVPRP